MESFFSSFRVGVGDEYVQGLESESELGIISFIFGIGSYSRFFEFWSQNRSQIRSRAGVGVE